MSVKWKWENGYTRLQTALTLNWNWRFQTQATGKLQKQCQWSCLWKVNHKWVGLDCVILQEALGTGLDELPASAGGSFLISHKHSKQNLVTSLGLVMVGAAARGVSQPSFMWAALRHVGRFTHPFSVFNREMKIRNTGRGWLCFLDLWGLKGCKASDSAGQLLFQSNKLVRSFPHSSVYMLFLHCGVKKFSLNNLFY